MNYKQQLKAIAGLASTVGGAYTAFKSAIYHVEPGHRALKFNKFDGVHEEIYREGYNFKMPWLERPIIYDVRTHPRVISSRTGSSDLQMVKIDLRVLYRPDPTKLPAIYRFLGMDYDGRVLPSVVNEVLKSVIARYTAQALLTQREQVSAKIRETLQARLQDFMIILDDVSITDLQFSEEFQKAIERKQTAQQEAERARYIVERAEQEAKSIVIRAQGEAEAAKMVGDSLKSAPSFLMLKRLEAASDIATTLSKSRNRIFLESDTLMLNLANSKFDQQVEELVKEAQSLPAKK